MRTLSSSARCCENICSTRIVGRSAVMHGRYCSFFTRNKSFSRNLHRVCIIRKVPRRQFLRESRIENRVEYRDSRLDPRFSRESRIECQLTFGRYCTCKCDYLYIGNIHQYQLIQIVCLVNSPPPSPLRALSISCHFHSCGVFIRV